MIKVHCKTNLDIYPWEKWPEMLPAVPRVGDYIESKSVNGKVLTLGVVSVTWAYRLNTFTHQEEWIPEIELHIPETQRHYLSITAWLKWYKEFRAQ